MSSNATSPQLNFGEQEVKVYLDGPFNYPGIKKNGLPVPVTQYEWQIPAGWTAKTGSVTSSGTYMTTASEIRLITDASSGGEVKVRGINDCADSGDYSNYSWPFTFTRSAGIKFLNYPQTIPMGEIGTHEFSVLLLTGVTYEWHAPSSWSINDGGNTYTGGNVVQITTGECPTNEKVLVRMVQENNFSPWVEFPTTVQLPAINLPSGQIKQFQPATFSLDMPDEKIESVEWLVNGSSVGMAINTSTLSFPINEPGQVKVSAKITLTGCAAVTTPEVEVDVVKAPDPVITGPSIVCDQATYVIDGLENWPAGTTVVWSTSNNNLLLVSGQGTATCTVKRNGNGMCNVRATINNSITITKYEIVVGAPDYNKIRVIKSGDDGVLCTDMPNEFYAEYDNDVKLFSDEVIEYEWHVSDNDWSIEEHPAANPGGALPGMSIMLLKPRAPSTWGYVYVRVRARNECGWSEWTPSLSFTKENCNRYFALFHDALSDIVTIEWQDESTRLLNDGSYEIQLWNSSALLRKFTTDQAVYQISVSGLPAGIYFVRIVKDGKTYTKKLMKR